MEDKYKNLKDIETAINTKPIKEIVKHIDFTKCLDEITLESPWTKKNFENNHIIDSELLIADNFQDHFQVVNDIIEKEEDILFYICAWYKEMEDKVRYYSCSGDLIKQRFYDEQVGEVIRKTFTKIYPEGIKKVGVVKLNKIIEKYLGYLPSFCLKPAPWELLNTKQDPTTEIVKQKLITYIGSKNQKAFNYIMLRLENTQILETTNSTYEYKWKAEVRDFAYFVSSIQGMKREVNYMAKHLTYIQWKPFLEAIEVRNQKGKLVKASECSDKISKINYSKLRNSYSISKTDETLYRIKQILDDAEKLLK